MFKIGDQAGAVMRFQVGDIVRCINSRRTEKVLEENRIYTNAVGLLKFADKRFELYQPYLAPDMTLDEIERAEEIYSKLVDG